MRTILMLMLTATVMPSVMAQSLDPAKDTTDREIQPTTTPISQSDQATVMSGSDVGVGADGTLWYIDKKLSIYKGSQQIDGGAAQISVDPNGAALRSK